MKLLVARRAHRAAETALAIEGPHGLLVGEATAGHGSGQQQLLSAQGLRIGGGTDFIQLNAIAERILGLPRQRHPDKDVPFRMTTAQRDGSE